MNKTILFVGLLCLNFFNASAQCEKCKMLDDEQSDFCYTSESFEGFCMQFGENSANFKFRGKGKIKSIPLGDGFDLDYIKTIALNKKLKISNWEFLFIVEGLKVWDIEKRKYGYEYEDSGLGIKLVREGKGDLPKKGENVEVHYTGYLEDGTKFDSSVDRNKTFSFPLGQNRVIKGWDEGVAKLRKGSVAWLRIPPDLGYGSRGAGGGQIPPNATLLFKIEVME